MPLTDVQIKMAKPQQKPYKLRDGRGLYVLVNPSGSKWWRQQYRFSEKPKLLSQGVYPDVGLKEARERCEQTRKQLAAGIDPSENRKAVKAARSEANANTFEVIAREWMQKNASTWAAATREKKERLFQRDLFPRLGKRPISQITVPELLSELRRIEGRGTGDTAHRALQVVGRVLRYAIVTGRAQNDISRDLAEALLPVKKGHFAAIVKPEEIGVLLRAIHVYQGNIITRSALQLAPLVFLRPGELRYAEWTEFDFHNAQWNVPAARMKIKNQGDHIVPLSKQSLDILDRLKPHSGEGRYVFPGLLTKHRPMSENTINTALRRMGFTKHEMTGHGFRATARTILDEVLKVRPEYIEHQLHHAVRDPNGRAYNRTTHLEERRRMMQIWADYLEQVANLRKSPSETF